SFAFPLASFASCLLTSRISSSNSRTLYFSNNPEQNSSFSLSIFALMALFNSSICARFSYWYRHRSRESLSNLSSVFDICPLFNQLITDSLFPDLYCQSHRPSYLHFQ